MSTQNRKLRRHTLYAPTRGINSRSAFFDTPEGFALAIYNGFTEGQSILSRPKWGNDKSVTSATGSNVGKLMPSVSRNAVLCGDGTDYYIVSFNPTNLGIFTWQPSTPTALTKSGGPTVTSNLKDGVSYLGHRFFAAFDASGNLNEVTDNIVVLQDAAYTGTGYSVSNVRFVQSFKQRLYLIEDGTTYYYSPVTALSGTVTGVDLSDYFDESTSLVYCGSYSQQAATTIDEQMVFVGDQGEVLIYSGDFPGATNWNLVAKLKVGPLLGRGEQISRVLKVGGDLYFLTVFGLISLRLAVQSGAQGALQTVSENIDPFFRAKFKDLSTSTADDKYDLSYFPSIEGIAILCRDNQISLDSSLDATEAIDAFVYHIPTQSWYVWTDLPVYDMREISGFIIGSDIAREKLMAAQYVYNTDEGGHTSANDGNQPLQIYYPFNHFGRPETNKIVKKLVVYFASRRSSSSAADRVLKYALAVDGEETWDFKTKLYASSATSSGQVDRHKLVIETTQKTVGNHISLALSFEGQINIEYFKTEVYYEEGGLT